MTFDTRQNSLRDAFDEDGFVTLPGFVAGKALSELQHRVTHYLEHIVPTLPPEHVFYEDRNDASSLKQLQQLGQHDPWFAQLLHDSEFRQAAEFFLQAPVVPRNLQYFNKPPLQGKPTPPHQDGFYFMLDPCDAVTMWLALDVVDAENGCVRYLPGSHRRGMRTHTRTQTLGFSQGIVDYPTASDSSGESAIPAMPGDLLVHHAMTIHRADGNTSATRSRRALGLVYYSIHAREDTLAHAEYQRRLTEELKASGRI